MLEIRPVQKRFIVFDTDEREAIMRFDSHDAATELVAELLMEESRYKNKKLLLPSVIFD